MISYKNNILVRNSKVKRLRNLWRTTSANYDKKNDTIVVFNVMAVIVSSSTEHHMSKYSDNPDKSLCTGDTAKKSILDPYNLWALHDSVMEINTWAQEPFSNRCLI